MKTESYNPSSLEKEVAAAIVQLKDEIGKHLSQCSIEKIESLINRDNPQVKFFLRDDDGDSHELVINIIQRSDELVGSRSEG